MSIPADWSTDQYFREDVYRQIRESVREGRSDAEIARRIGISTQAVFRYRKRSGLPAYDAEARR
jgi:transposase-like protein